MWVGIVAVLIAGVMVGVEFSVAVFVNPIFDRLPADGGIAARSDGAKVLGRVMPFWYIGSLLLVIWWVIAAWSDPRTWAAIVAGVLLVVTVIMSVLLLVPINDRVRTWSAGPVPDDWKQQMSRWDRMHQLRVAILVVAFTLLIFALAG